MTNEEAIKFLSQIMDAILASNSWLPSTDNPIKESFGMAINALEAQEKSQEVSNNSPELVRCGQCKYAEVADVQDNQDGYTCQFHRGSIWFSGSYCSWAERRTDEVD